MDHRSTSSCLPHIDNEKQFSLIRNKLLGQSTGLQIPATTNPTTISISTFSTTPVTLELTTSIVAIANHNKSYQQKLIIHYKHEKRFHSFKRDLHQVHDSIFHNTPVQDLRLIVGNRNRRDARHELIRKRPKRLMLKNIAKKRKKSVPSAIRHTLTKSLIYISPFLAKRPQRRIKTNITSSFVR